jgi:hypothetical protein
MSCPKCDGELEKDQLCCNASGEGIEVEQEAEDRWMSRPSTIAGWLNFADGFLKMLALFGLIGLMEVVARDRGRSPKEVDDLETVLIAITVFLAVTASIALVSCGYALQRKNWGMALAGAIGALLPNVPLGALSLIMLMKDRKKFE